MVSSAPFPPCRDIIKCSFTGHETFAFRYGWLKKGVDAVYANSTVFSSDEALVTLGVGKNMVGSIRNWCLAAQLIEEDTFTPKNRGRSLVPTELGKKLLLDGAWDPYMEDPASLWLIHWLLSSNTERATTWHLAFHRFVRLDFSKLDLYNFIKGFAENQGWTVNDSSLSRDIDTFLHTYVPNRLGTGALVEDSLDCPLTELCVISSLGVYDLYRFAVGPKPSLPAEIFGYAFLKFFELTHSQSNTITIQDCLYRAGSPGQAFKLDEGSLVEYISELQEITDGALTLDETAGLWQVYRKAPIEPIDLLARFYEKGSKY